MQTGFRFSWLFIIALTVAILMPSLAMAQIEVPALPDGKTIFDILRPDPNDASIMWLIGIFGPFIGGSSVPSEAIPIVVLALGLFNLAAITLAAILLLYKLIVGVVQTAHDGEVLGRRWSTLWGPVRVALAAIALAPIQNGLNLLQIAVLILASVGVGLANGMWAVSVDALAKTGNPVGFLQPNDGMIGVANGVSQINLCINFANTWAMNNQDLLLRKNIDVSNGFIVQHTNQDSPEVKHIIINYGPKDKSINLPQDLCGSVRYSRGGITAYGLPDNDAVWQEISKTVGGDTPAAAQSTAINAFSSSITPVSMALIEKHYPHIGMDEGGGELNDPRTHVDKIFPAILEMNIVQSKVASEIMARAKAGNLDSFSEYAKGKGWAYAGVWWIELARYSSAINAVTTQNASVQTPDWSTVAERLQGLIASGESGNKRALESAGVLQQLVNERDELWNLAVTQGSATDTEIECEGDADEQRCFATRTTLSAPKMAIEIAKNPSYMVHAVGQRLSMGSPSVSSGNNGQEGIGRPFGFVQSSWSPLHKVTDQGQNPLVAISDFGRTIIKTLGWMIGVCYGIYVVAKGIEGVGDSAFMKFLGPIGAVVTVGSKVIAAVAMPVVSLGIVLASVFLIPGIFLGYVLPALPYILWMGAVLGWLILVIEAVVAAPLWALAHMRMDGEGLAGPDGQAGYKIIYSMLLRPGLMIAGLLLGFVTYTVFGSFINDSFAVAKASLEGPPGTGVIGAVNNTILYIVGLIVYIFMFAYLHFWLAKRCFSLMHELPDRILRWIGAGREGLGEESALESSAGTMAAMTMMGTAFGAMDRRFIAARGAAGQKGDPDSQGQITAAGPSGGGGSGGGSAGGAGTTAAATAMKAYAAGDRLRNMSGSELKMAGGGTSGAMGAAAQSLGQGAGSVSGQIGSAGSGFAQASSGGGGETGAGESSSDQKTGSDAEQDATASSTDRSTTQLSSGGDNKSSTGRDREV